MKKTFLFLLIILLTTHLTGQDRPLKGYQEKVRGEDLKYHSPHDNVNESLLVRSEHEDNYIEWKTEAVPEEMTGNMIRFIFMAGIDVNPEDKHIFNFYADGNHLFTLANPDDTTQNPVIWKAEADISLDFDKLLVDKYGDLMGYFHLTLTNDHLTPGKPLVLRVQGETSGSRSWFMVFKKAVKPEFFIIEEQALVRDEDGHVFQQLRLDMVHLDDPAKVEVTADGMRNILKLKKGYNVTRFTLPEVKRERMIVVTIRNLETGHTQARNVWVHPVNHMEVHLLHHSHVDIGYTDAQEVVLEKQWNHLEKALKLSEATRDYPPEARFRWNIEVMWALSEYLYKATPGQKQAVIGALQEGTLELGAFYGNQLLGLCNEEELMRLTEAARKLSKEAGVPLRAAMISDIPGWSWGAIPVLAKSGVRYLSLGTNESHRIGNTRIHHTDRPFYWVSPSGLDSVLTWIHGAGYSMFHTGLGYENINRKQAESKIMAYVQELMNTGYPYDLVPLRYNIGSDNGPPDEMLPDFVKAWNERYVTPKLVISTVSEVFGRIEKDHGGNLPVLSGDFTCYWEDGALSSARETAMNQASAERLGQAERLWAMLDAQGFPHEDFNEAWEMVMLFNEHTWGSWNSISEPLSEFTLHQWEVKRSFAENADKLSRELLARAVASAVKADDENITVFNTHAWSVTGPVSVKTNRDPDGLYVTDARGLLVPSQVDKDGQIVFMAKDIPALGWKRYQLKSGTLKALPMQPLNSQGRHETEFFEIWWERQNGQIVSLIDLKRRDYNWVSVMETDNFNRYHYVAGRDPSNAVRDSFVSFEEVARGPVFTTHRTVSEGPGAESVVKEVTVYSGLDYLEIHNQIDKTLVYEPEGVHFSLPLYLPNGKLKVSLPFAPYSVGEEQIEGSNKNFVTANRYVDLSNDERGMAIISPDAPIFEIGGITTDATIFGWKDKAGKQSRPYSYVMNNYWETNYLAAQEGEVSFRYYLYPHDAAEMTAVEKKAMEITRPLIAVKGALDKDSRQLLALNDEALIVTGIKPSADGKAVMLTVWNTSEEVKELVMFWSEVQPYRIYISNPDEEPVEQVAGRIMIQPGDFISVRAEF